MYTVQIRNINNEWKSIWNMRIWIMLMVKTRICVTSVQPLFSYTWPTCQFFSTVWIRSKINYLSLSIYINRRTRYIWKIINWSDKSCKSCTNQNIQIYHYSNMHLICGIELNETKMKKTNLHNRKMDWFMVIAILFCTSRVSLSRFLTQSPSNQSIHLELGTRK